MNDIKIAILLGKVFGLFILFILILFLFKGRR